MGCRPEPMPVNRALPPIPQAVTRTEAAAVPWLSSEPARAETVAVGTVYLHVTRACNLRCSYCYFAASRPLPDEMSGEELTPVWPQLVALRPQKVVFTGGEPLLRADLLDLMRSLRAADPDHRVLRCLNTNGHLVTPQLAQQLVGLADEVRVSLDGLAERNDAQRGPGNFTAALNALECLHELGFEPKALITLTSQSLPDLEDLLCLLAERGITRVNLNTIRLIGRARHNTAWQVDPADVNAATERAWARRYPQQPPPPAPPAPTAPINCGVGQFLNITPNGDVYPCHVLTHREFCCGNLREESLLTICRQTGPLGRLAALDVNDLPRKDPGLAAARCDTCLGDIYAATRSLPIWVDILPHPSGSQAPARSRPHVSK